MEVYFSVKRAVSNMWNQPQVPSQAERSLIPTFEDDLQLISQDVKDTVSGAGLWDDVPVQPAPAGVLVEILAWVSCWVHVLDYSSSWVSELERWIPEAAQ